MLQGSQHDFPVTREGRVVGVLTRDGLLRALAEKPATTPVEMIMEREFREVESGEMLESVFARLQECQCHTLPVTRGGALVGLVTSDNIGEFLMIQSALGTNATVPPMLAEAQAG